MAAHPLAAAAASLEPHEAAVILELVTVLERLTAGQEQIAEALGAFDRLDDLRQAEIAELRLTVRLLCMLHGLETKGPPLAESAMHAPDCMIFTPASEGICTCGGDRRASKAWVALALTYAPDGPRGRFSFPRTGHGEGDGDA